MVTWTLVTVGYVAPSVLGAVGLKTTGEAVARWGACRHPLGLRSTRVAPEAPVSPARAR